jgi:hypothetical protein
MQVLEQKDGMLAARSHPNATHIRCDPPCNTVFAWEERDPSGTVVCPSCKTMAVGLLKKKIAGDVEVAPKDLVGFADKLGDAVSAENTKQVEKEQAAPAAVALLDAKVGTEKVRMTTMKENFAALAEKARAIPRDLNDTANSLHARLNAVSMKGHAAFDKMHSVVADAEAGVAAAEDAVNQLTNSPLA